LGLREGGYLEKTSVCQRGEGKEAWGGVQGGFSDGGIHYKHSIIRMKEGVKEVVFFLTGGGGVGRDTNHPLALWEGGHLLGPRKPLGGSMG